MTLSGWVLSFSLTMPRSWYPGLFSYSGLSSMFTTEMPNVVSFLIRSCHWFPTSPISAILISTESAKPDSQSLTYCTLRRTSWTFCELPPIVSGASRGIRYWYHPSFPPPAMYRFSSRTPSRV